MVRRRGTRERLEDIRNAAEDALAFASGLDAVAFAARVAGAPPGRGLARLSGAARRCVASVFQPGTAAPAPDRGE